MTTYAWSTITTAQGLSFTTGDVLAFDTGGTASAITTSVGAAVTTLTLAGKSVVFTNTALNGGAGEFLTLDGSVLRIDATGGASAGPYTGSALGDQFVNVNTGAGDDSFIGNAGSVCKCLFLSRQEWLESLLVDRFHIGFVR